MAEGLQTDSTDVALLYTAMKLTMESKYTNTDALVANYKTIYDAVYKAWLAARNS